jgi:lipoprotein-releasing system permease protein
VIEGFLVKTDFSIFLGSRLSRLPKERYLLRFLGQVAVTGLAFSVALLLIVLSVMNGFDREMQEKILNLVPHIMITNSQGALEQHNSLLSELQATEGVQRIEMEISLQGALKQGSHLAPVRITGVSSSRRELIENMFNTSLSLDSGQKSDRLPVASIGAGLSKSSTLKVGDTALFLVSPPRGNRQPVYMSFMIGSVFETGTEFDRNQVLVSYDNLGRMSGGLPTSVNVYLDDIFSASSMAREIYSKMDSGYDMTTWFYTHGDLYESIQLSRSLVTTLMLVIIAVAIFNVVATIYIIVSNNRPAIAILLTMGATPAQILQAFLIQVLYLCTNGMFWGLLAGCLVSLYISDMIAWVEQLYGFAFLDLGVYPINYIPSDLQGSDIVMIILVTLFFSLTASWVPASRTCRLEPAEVLSGH